MATSIAFQFMVVSVVLALSFGTDSIMWTYDTERIAEDVLTLKRPDGDFLYMSAEMIDTTGDCDGDTVTYEVEGGGVFESGLVMCNAQLDGPIDVDVLYIRSFNCSDGFSS